MTFWDRTVNRELSITTEYLTGHVTSLQKTCRFSPYILTFILIDKTGENAGRRKNAILCTFLYDLLKIWALCSTFFAGTLLL